MIKVVVVDDSAFMRKALAAMLSKDPEIEVVGAARDGEEGLEMIRRHQPDVVTLDIEMPRMDGLTALRHITTVRKHTRREPNQLVAAINCLEPHLARQVANRVTLLATQSTP